MGKFVKIFFFTFIVFLSSNLKSQTTLTPGQVAITGFNFDDPDQFSFVLLTNTTTGTVINFTDNGWLASGSFRAGEGTCTWTSTSNLTCGTEVTITATVASTGTVSANTMNFSTSGDQIIVYQGAAATPTLLNALNSEGAAVWQADATSANTSALPTGLVNGTNAIALTEVDNAVYNCTVISGSASILAGVCNTSNWTVNDVTRVTLGSGCAFTCVTNTITTSAIVGSPFSVTCTAGTALNVDFTSVGTFTAGNVYTAEISDNLGSFISPTTIGTLTSTANAGSIACNLPANFTAGTLYRIRVISSTPAIVGTDNGTNLTVNFSGAACGVTTSAIAGSPFAVTCSAGAAVNVDFTSVGTFTAGNVYTAQLSNSAGSFASPVIIGTLTSTANAGTISATIPAATLTGAGYRIRVVSSTPFYNGSDNGSNLTINLTGGPCTVGITTGVISGSPFTVDCSTWENTDVPFTAIGTYNVGNLFTAQLSDASGSFAFPITIGQIALSGVDPASTIPSTIFAGLTPSANYRIRVIATNPATTGTDNGINLTVNNASSPCYGPIIMNEMSQGGSGNKEYFELLVIANDPCATMDIRNFIFDDNNGDFSGGASSGTGIAAGHMRFTNANQWSNVPSGSLIVVYNSADVNGSVPADDPSDLIISDKVYILPSNSSLLEGCVTRPTSSDNSYSPCVYGVGNWNYISMANGADACQVRYPNGIYSHGFSWGTATLPAVMDGGPDNLLIGTTGTSGANIGFENTTNNDYTLAANFARGTVPTDETPGAPNSAANAAFIATLTCTALPVELLDFNVIKQENFNYVFWTTSTEINTSHFVLERSIDMQNFREIAQINASGNSNSPKNYSCADDHPENGYSYYRLKIVDLNGETQYSQVRMVYRSKLFDMPTLNGNLFDLSPCETGSIIKVFDATGKLIEQRVTSGENYSIDHLQNGFYLVQIICNRSEYIFKTSLQK